MSPAGATSSLGSRRPPRRTRNRRRHRSLAESPQPTGSVAAASIVITMPIVVTVPFLQRRIMAGHAAGAVKGELKRLQAGSWTRARAPAGTQPLAPLLTLCASITVRSHLMRGPVSRSRPSWWLEQATDP